MKKSKSLYRDHRSPADVISCAVRWAALEPGTAQYRHRSVAQLSAGKSGDPGTCDVKQVFVKAAAD